LFILFLAPRFPFKPVLGPIIKTFWGETFLHYPYNFLLLPKLASLSRMFISVVLGGLTTGMAIAITGDAFSNKNTRWNKIFQLSLKKYFSLFLITLLATLLFYFSVKFTDAVLVKFSAAHRKIFSLNLQVLIGPILIALNLFIGVFLQGLFAFAVPYLMIENEKTLMSIFKSIGLFFRKLFIPTMVLVALPMLLYIPVIILNSNTGNLVNNVFPESVLLIGFLAIIVNSLIIDPLLTVSTCALFLLSNRGNAPKPK
jgi:hypothetical protein